MSNGKCLLTLRNPAVHIGAKGSSIKDVLAKTDFLDPPPCLTSSVWQTPPPPPVDRNIFWSGSQYILRFGRFYAGYDPDVRNRWGGAVFGRTSLMDDPLQDIRH